MKNYPLKSQELVNDCVTQQHKLTMYELSFLDAIQDELDNKIIITPPQASKLLLIWRRIKKNEEATNRYKE